MNAVVNVLMLVLFARLTARAVEAAVEMPGMPTVRSATALIVDTWVETTLLSAVNAVVRVLTELLVLFATVRVVPATVDALYAVPRAVEAVVEMPGMPTVRSATPVIVDTWVETTVLNAVNAFVKEDTELLFSVAIPRAVEAVVEMPGMPALIRTSDAIVDT